MARRHEVDPVTQGALLAPPSPASLAMGKVVEIEGGFYQGEPESHKTELTPEQRALKDESSAILMLDKACTSARRIKGMEKHQHNLETGDVGENTDVPTELHRLAHRDEQTGEILGAVRNAQENRMHFRRQARQYFGRSIGIETFVRPEVRKYKGVPQEVLMVRAADPARHEEFEHRFKQFYETYGQLNQSMARERRRQEIEALL